MKKSLLLALVAAVTGVVANATVVTLNCTPYPALINNGAGSATIVCPGVPAGAMSVTSASLVYYVDYLFGTAPANGVSVTFTPSASGVTFTTPSTVVTNSGAASSGGVTQGTATASAGATAANLASSFNVGVVSSVTAGAVTSTTAGVQVTYNYSTVPATPAPSSLYLAGFSILGLGVFAFFRTRAAKA